MKRLIALLLVLAASSIAGVFFAKYPGYLLIATKHWRIETTLWLGILSIIIICFVLAICLRIIKKIMYLRTGMHSWISRRRRRHSDTLSNQGLCELAEAHWKKAEDKLIRAAQNSQTPLMNFLGAARAAQALGALDRRDQYLKQAIESTPEAVKAVGLSQAQLQLEANQLEQACASLQVLRQQYPKHQHVLSLLQKTYTLLEDWPQLIELNKDLRRYRCLDKETCHDLLLHAQSQQFLDNIKTSDASTIRDAWQSLGKAGQCLPGNVLAYARYLLQSGDHQEACAILLSLQQTACDPQALTLIGQLSRDAAETAFKSAEQWASKHPTNAKLHETLGRLSITLQLWSKAKHYLSKAIEIEPSAQRYFILASVYQACDETDAMEQCIKDGLACPAA